jgi:tetrahydromethanopterin S-methyltransferase subunit F
MTPQRFQGFAVGILLAALLLLVGISLFIVGTYH